MRIPREVTEIDATAFDNAPNLVIECYTDSAAHQFAKAHHLRHRLLDGFDIGNVDLDGEVTVVDVTLLQKHCAGLATLSEEQLACADLNADGVIDVTDATAIQRLLAGLEEYYYQ